VNVKISKASEEELEYWENKLKFYDFVVADLRLRGIDYIVPVKMADVANVADVAEPTVECIRYQNNHMNNRFHPSKNSWEEQVNLIVYPTDSDWEKIMMLTRGKVRKKLGNLIQNFEQEEAIKLVQGFDKEVVDHIENLKACGKGDDSSLVFHEATRKFYQYIITNINKEFEVVARNYVTGTPHAYKAGSVNWRKILGGERAKKWADTTDMISSPINAWDAMRIMFNGRKMKEGNMMIRDGDGNGIIAKIQSERAVAMKKLGGASGEELEYWENKQKFYDFVVADINLRMGIEETPTGEVVPALVKFAFEIPPPEGPYVVEEPIVLEPPVACNKRYIVHNMNRFFNPHFKSWEDMTKMLVNPPDSDWEAVMMITRGSVRRDVGNLIQNFEQEKAVAMIQSYDQQVVDQIKNYNECGKGSDPSMAFHRAHHEFYLAVIEQINKEFEVVARDFVTGTAHAYNPGKLTWRTLFDAERYKKWAEATDMISSPVSIWSAMTLLYQGKKVRKPNNMIKDGDGDGILAAIQERREIDEKKLEKASGEELEYWKNKLKFYDFVVIDIKLRLDIE